MKKILRAIILACLGTAAAFAQTATNFNCNDCSGVNHDLYTELNAGKVVVICWVMPCATCIPGALAAQSACQSFAGSNPGQVLFYVVDDYANTSCATLSGWCTTNGITTATKFSNAAIDMNDYGSPGMPKVVVLGGSNYGVYYNQNNGTVSTSGIQTAIGNALSAVGINSAQSPVKSASVYPNPANSSAQLSISIEKEITVDVSLFDQQGKKVAAVFSGKLQKGEHVLSIATNELQQGSYTVCIAEGNKTKKIRLVVIH